MLLDLVNTVGQRIGWTLEIGSRWGFRRSRCRWCRTELRRRRGQTCGPWRCRRNCHRRLTGKFRPLQCLGRVRLQWHKGIFVFVFLYCKRRCEAVEDLRWGFKKLCSGWSWHAFFSTKKTSEQLSEIVIVFFK
jgi:hypothetical protein